MSEEITIAISSGKGNFNHYPAQHSRKDAHAKTNSASFNSKFPVQYQIQKPKIAFARLITSPSPLNFSKPNAALPLLPVNNCSSPLPTCLLSPTPPGKSGGGTPRRNASFCAFM